MHMSLNKTLIVFAMSCGVLTSGSAWSADYPNKAIRMIVPYSAGGGADNAARIIAKTLGDTLKQPIVIENKPGASALSARPKWRARLPMATPCCMMHPLFPSIRYCANCRMTR